MYLAQRVDSAVRSTLPANRTERPLPKVSSLGFAPAVPMLAACEAECGGGPRADSRSTIRCSLSFLREDSKPRLALFHSRRICAGTRAYSVIVRVYSAHN